MRAVVQRVKEASVTIDGVVKGKIKSGLLVFLGIGAGDNEADIEYICSKVLGLRIFEDEEGKMNLPVSNVHGSILLVSQFTLHGDCRKGKRPNFSEAMEPGAAYVLYEKTIERMKNGDVPVETGEFQAMMAVALVNDGPVTILLDSKRSF
jgi:D-aminoacyl-tRNA deacylase